MEIKNLSELMTYCENKNTYVKEYKDNKAYLENWEVIDF